MSNNRKLQCYAYFTHELFCCLANQIHGHIRVMLEYKIEYLDSRKSDNMSFTVIKEGYRGFTIYLP